MITDQSTRNYLVVGGLAIIAGGLVSALSAKSPSTLAMWSSAYLVLVVGVTQIYLGYALWRLTKPSDDWWKWWLFVGFNLASAVVIASTALKYGGFEQHVGLTAVGSAMMIAVFGFMAWQLRKSKSSAIKTLTYVVISATAVLSLVGLWLASYH